MASGKVNNTGQIDSRTIAQAREDMYNILTGYKELKKRVDDNTTKLKQNWVGKGRNEFESQYKLLISKVSDIGDCLEDMYEGLVDAEASFADTDDQIRQNMAMNG